MNKRTIAVDIDDVIAAHAPAFIEYTNKTFGTNLTLNDYSGDHWFKVWNVDGIEGEKRALEYHASGHIATYRPIEGASEALAKLKNDFRLILLTTRRRSIDQLTLDWIDKFYPGIFDEIIFAGFFDKPSEDNVNHTKAEIAIKNNASFIIDDQLKHCLSAADVGIPAVLFGDYHWNKINNLPSLVTRAANWQEVLDYFSNA